MARQLDIKWLSNCDKLNIHFEKGKKIMKNLLNRNTLLILSLSLIVGLSIACTPPAANTNVSTNGNTTVNADANANSDMNMNSSNSEAINDSSAIEAEEPNKYQATVVLSAETKGKTNTAIPKLTANVARDGENRRMEISMPNGEKVIYLTVGEKQYIISPARKQYAELDKESLGVDVRKVLTPDQIVSQVKRYKGVRRVGEEEYKGRNVIKYDFASTTDTQTKAGEIDTESYILVDKETNLPVRSVTNMQSESGQVQGISGLQIVTEINDIKTEVDESLFKEPTDYKKVESEEIRTQLKSYFDAAQLVLGQLLKASQSANN